MTIWTSLEPPSATVEAGGSVTVTLRIRNTGDVVEEYRVVPTGDPAVWATVEPATLKLYPGTTGSVQVTFRPPRTPDATAGPNPYALQVVPTEFPESTTVPEGNLTITPFTEIRAELLPPTCRGRFRGRPKLAIDNLGNVKLTASLSGQDTGNQLGFDIRPGSLQIEPGRAAFTKVRIKPNRVLWTGQKETRPFGISIQRSGAETVKVDGSYLQHSVMPRWLMTVGGLLTAMALAFVALWLAVRPSVGSNAHEVADGAPVADASALPAPGPVLPPPSNAPAQAAPSGPAAPGGDPLSGGGGAAPTAVPPAGGMPSLAAPPPAGPPPAINPQPQGGGSSTPAKPVANLPIKPSAPANIFVQFAQYRLAALGQDNPCLLKAPFSVGKLDGKTVNSLSCFQKATDAARKGHLVQDENGVLGRETMTALWAYGFLNQQSALAPGQANWPVLAASGALEWAQYTIVNHDDVARDAQYAQYGIYYLAGRAQANAAADAGFQAAVRAYQQSVGLPVSGTVDTATYNALAGGAVKGGSDPGTATGDNWIPGPVS